MGKIRYLKASTILETMVAAIIFLIAFLAGMESIVNATSIKSDTLVYIQADNQYRQCLSDCRRNLYTKCEYTKQYEWGEIILIVEPYSYYEQVFQVTIRVMVGHDMEEYIHILEK